MQPITPEPSQTAGRSRRPFPEFTYLHHPDAAAMSFWNERKKTASSVVLPWVPCPKQNKILSCTHVGGKKEKKPHECNVTLSWQLWDFIVCDVVGIDRYGIRTPVFPRSSSGLEMELMVKTRRLCVRNRPLLSCFLSFLFLNLPMYNTFLCVLFALCSLLFST